MNTCYGDTCPACGSSEVLPYAVILGGTEEYGYQCQACQVSWPVLTHHDAIPAPIAASLHGARSVASRV